MFSTRVGTITLKLPLTLCTRPISEMTLFELVHKLESIVISLCNLLEYLVGEKNIFVSLGFISH